MPVTSARITVTTAATLLADQAEAIAPMTVTVKNAGTVSVDLGGPDVAAGSGYELTTSSPPITITLTADDHALYARATTTGRVDVVRIQ
jgi:hypothetical protein